MAAPCYYHPDTPAVDTCVQCGMPICQQCRDRVAEKTVCRNCVGAVRARLEQQMATGGPPQSVSSAPAYAAASGPRVSAAVAAKPDSGRLLMALGLALVIGIVGALITEKIQFYAHFDLSLLYVGIGYGIGFALHSILGRGGGGLALAACGVMLVSLFIGELFWVQDIVGLVNAKEGSAGAITFAEAFPVAMSAHGIIHWVCILFGLMACYRGVAQQG